MKIYQVKIYWYDEFNDKQNIDNAFIFATTYSEALT